MSRWHTPPWSEYVARAQQAVDDRELKGNQRTLTEVADLADRDIVIYVDEGTGIRAHVPAMTEVMFGRPMAFELALVVQDQQGKQATRTH
ncbi:MAG: hypothetical protein Unbinned7358contig1000_10 [Prokaryotic dsDNA virus sp.]|nr:MAG: hypothetical protein Unbinned7358contig1000_10 [Prokaryotic dsDNA virus sp.]|tara:strand:- start:8627 stop:8896 length:270 start_codon:yes stop_codon:yes gene_type:complete